MPKFGDYTEDTAPATGDVVIYKDVSATETNRITLLDLWKAFVGFLSSFTAASALDGTEIVAVSQGGNPRKTTTQDIADLASGGGGSIAPLAVVNANTVKQANSTNAQTFHVAATDDGAGNAEYLTQNYTGGYFVLSPTKTGTGTFRHLRIESNSGILDFYDGGAAYFRMNGSKLFPHAAGGLDLGKTGNEFGKVWSNVAILTPTAFASLPAGSEGMMAWVNDSNTATWGATVAGGGANKVLAVYNGANWTVAGK